MARHSTPNSTLGATAPALALAMIFSAGASWADLTAEDVWADWQGYLSSAGYDVTATQSQSGNTLSVTDITLGMVLPEDEGNMTADLGRLDFEEMGDGTVSVRLPASMPMSLTLDVVDEGEMTVGFEFTNSGFDMRAAGVPADLTYTYSADEIGFALTGIESDGETIDTGTFTVNMANVVGETLMKIGDLRSSVQKMTSESLVYKVDFTDPELGGTLQWESTIQGLDLIGNGAVPIQSDLTDMAAAISDGFAADATMRFGSGQTKIRFQDSATEFSADTSSEGGTFQAGFGANGLGYTLGTTGLKVFFQGNDVPFPVEAAIGEAALNLLLPISKSEEMQDFAFGLTLGDFTMSDLIWGIFDPGAQLPRDPATVALDMTGKMRLFLDLLNADDMAAIEATGAAPGEVDSVTLNDLRISLAGAELTGQGAFTFDNSDTETYDGLPKPEGAVDLTLTGGNGLLDKLIAMQLLPEEQAMGVRMMMGLFAVPGEGADTLNSKIEVTPDGQLLANGQRLR
ncbi:MAG: hypothetical protein AAGA28_15025 [Pseudomonadota bacterium]